MVHVVSKMGLTVEESSIASRFITVLISVVEIWPRNKTRDLWYCS